MGTEFITGYSDLQSELDEAKNTLVMLNDNIRRIVGRRSDKHKIQYEVRKNDNNDSRQGQRPSLNDSSKFKRRSHDTKSVFNRLSAPAVRSMTNDEEIRPRLTSRVIREMPTREQILEAQGGTDSESRARNRRMFGSLLGTLHKFCQEESRLKGKEDKKAQIEKKLEEQEAQERESLKKERELLFQDRKRKQMEIRNLELKMNRLKDFEMWEKSMMPLKQHIRTKTKPCIYFKPKIMNKKTEKLLQESQNNIDTIVQQRRDALKTELTEIENNFKMNESDYEDQLDSTTNHNTDGILDATVRRAKRERERERERDRERDDEEESNDSRSHHGSFIASEIIAIKDEPMDDDNTKNDEQPIVCSSIVVVNNYNNNNNNNNSTVKDEVQ